MHTKRKRKYCFYHPKGDKQLVISEGRVAEGRSKEGWKEKGRRRSKTESSVTVKNAYPSHGKRKKEAG